MSRTALLACLTVAVAVPLAAQNNLKSQFESLDDKGDHAGVVALWKTNPARVLGTIDSYLEGALKILESDDPDVSKIKGMHARALRGARAADEASGRSIFSDYTSSFVGWNAAQQKRFRAGQGAFSAHRKAMKGGKLDEALAQAEKCHDLALPLGDWWGTAMGLSGMGAALEQTGKLERALSAHSRARLLYQSLGLSSELTNLTAMARILVKLERKPRARVTVDKAMAMAKASGRRGERTLAELQELRVSLGG